ncbi:MAG: restriction endonuclease [candidate division NC10 bacterium]|nr:restriction endonuclease [candidate division NC10 bacterium]MBI3002569.1 restriction endonuclease [candidate division NC10 bacterium]
MFTLVAVAVLLGFVLIGLILFSSRRTPVVMEKDFYRDRGAPPAGIGGLAMPQFERLCLKLLEEMGLVVDRVSRPSERELDIQAVNPQPVTGGDYLVHCILAEADEPVHPSRVTALADTVKGERATKGILITTGYFAEEVAKRLEGPPVELINGQRFAQLLSEFGIPVT